MSGLNSNLSQPPMFPSGQNAFSPSTSASQPPGFSKPPYSLQGSAANPHMSPVSATQTFSPSGMVPPVAQNYNYASSPQVPLMDSSIKSPVSFTNHSPIPPTSPKNTLPVGERQNFVQNGPITNSPFSSSNSGPNLNNETFQVNGHNGSNNSLGPPLCMPPPAQNRWTSPSRLPPPPGGQNQKLSTPSMGISPAVSSPFTGASPYSNVIDGKPVPKMSQVPSAGILLIHTIKNSFICILF